MEKGNLYIVRTLQPKLLKSLLKQGLISDLVKLAGSGAPRKSKKPGRATKASKSSKA